MAQRCECDFSNQICNGSLDLNNHLGNSYLTAQQILIATEVIALAYLTLSKLLEEVVCKSYAC